MRKNEEINDPSSCLNRAKSDEIIFVLLARDAASLVTIRAWCAERVRLGKNTWDDCQIRDALHCAEAMEKQRYANSYQGSTALEINGRIFIVNNDGRAEGQS